MRKVPVIRCKGFTAILDTRYTHGYFEGYIELVQKGCDGSFGFSCLPLRDSPSEAMQDAREYVQRLEEMWPPEWH